MLFFNMERRIPIPKLLYRTDTDAPFESCILCDRKFEDINQPYFIEKAIRSHQKLGVVDTVFEYAVCLPCQTEMMTKISLESMQQLQAYLAPLQVKMYERMQQLAQVPVQEAPEPWISHCLVKGTPREELDQYQLDVLCMGNELILGATPYLIGSEALIELSELLSAETRDEMDHFAEEFFGLPPELNELFKGPKIAIF